MSIFFLVEMSFRNFAFKKKKNFCLFHILYIFGFVLWVLVRNIPHVLKHGVVEERTCQINMMVSFPLREKYELRQVFF